MDVNILKRVYILLCVLNSKEKPNWDLVESYGFETAQMIQKKYPWYRPSPSIHTLCLHGKDVMSRRELGPGCYSESSQESYNKIDRNVREFHARKCSRKANLTDIFQNHLAYGDPIFSSSMKTLPPMNLPKMAELKNLMSVKKNMEEEEEENDDSEYSDSDYSQSEIDPESDLDT